jgi:hypothetical protein
MPVTITTRTAPPAHGVPGEVDSLFVMSADTGAPTTPKVIRALGDYETLGATRTGDPLTYDGLDNYFREGGRQAVVVKKGASVAATLPLFTEDFGGGHVVAWANTVTAGDQLALAQHAQTNKRFALLDSNLADDTVAKLTTLAGTLPATVTDYYTAVGPWLQIPAPAGVTGGSVRSVPASSTLAALIARSDALGNPNRAPAGRDFPLQYATGTIATASMSDTEAATLRAAGLNPIRPKFGLYVLDGFQTKVVVSADNPFWQANCARARMWLQWNSVDIGLNYEYKSIDGRGRLAKALKTDLEALCKSLWEVDGLYGNSPSDAYAVEVGVSVNTDATVALGELHAVVEARFSLHARTVIIELVTVPITGRVSQGV